MSTGRGNYLLLGIVLLLGVGENQLAGTNLGSGTAGGDAGLRSGGGSSGESPRTPPKPVRQHLPVKRVCESSNCTTGLNCIVINN